MPDDVTLALVSLTMRDGLLLVAAITHMTRLLMAGRYYDGAFAELLRRQPYATRLTPCSSSIMPQAFHYAITPFPP